MKQLDFFAVEQPASAEIIAFPIDRRTVMIRETARLLIGKKGVAADRFWQTTCRRLFAQLQVQGLAEPDIRSEIDAFAHAVHAEIQHVAWDQWAADHPNDAA